MSKHSSLRDHIFIRPADRACCECTVCGFVLDDVTAHEFGVDSGDLFIMDESPDFVPDEPDGIPIIEKLNYGVISDTLKNKYVPAFAEKIYDSSSLLSLIKKNMKTAQRGLKNQLAEDLFGPPMPKRLFESKQFQEAQYPELMNPQGFGG